MPVLTALSCPVCGGPFHDWTDRCQWCGSLVVIQSDHPRIDPGTLNQTVIDESIRGFRHLLRTNPNDEAALYGLGVAYFNLGLLEDSVTQLVEAARLTPENIYIQTQLAVVYIDLAARGHPSALQHARDRIQRALLLRPNHTEALIVSASIARATGDLSTAVELWRRIASTAPHLVFQRLHRFVMEHVSELRPVPLSRQERVERLKSDAGRGAAWLILIIVILNLLIRGVGNRNPVQLLIGAVLLVAFVIYLRRYRFLKRTSSDRRLRDDQLLDQAQSSTVATDLLVQAALRIIERRREVTASTTSG